MDDVVQESNSNGNRPQRRWPIFVTKILFSHPCTQPGRLWAADGDNKFYVYSHNFNDWLKSFCRSKIPTHRQKTSIRNETDWHERNVLLIVADCQSLNEVAEFIYRTDDASAFIDPTDRNHCVKYKCMGLRRRINIGQGWHRLRRQFNVQLVFRI